MKRLPRVLLLLLPLLAADRAAAQTSPVLDALRQRNWPAAERLAATNPDPLATRLVTFIRLLTPGQATPGELVHFMAANPAWPDQPVLERRFADALADDPDRAQVARLCQVHPTSVATGLQACAAAFADTGQPKAAAQAARDAWVGGITDAGEEAAFLARWGPVLTPADQWRRFDLLEATDAAAAQRQLPRLDGDHRALGAARLALRRMEANALSTLPSVPEKLRSDPLLVLAEARFLRRSQADAAALALWRTAMPAAEAAAPAAQRAAFWTERDALARHLLAAGDADGAYFLADDADLAPDQAVDAQFLAGWIAFRRLHDPVRAAAHFRALADGTHAAISQARAWYWLGRVAAKGEEASADYAKAAAWPATFYGQEALRAFHGQAQPRAAGQDDGQGRILALHDPAASGAEAAAFTGSEMARAAVILVAWDDPRRAVDFLMRAAQPPAGAGTRALVAQTALRLGLPDVAVQTARLVGRDGGVLATSGWPIPVRPPPGPVPAPLALGLMRQESSFDAHIVSKAGAHGLMQLMAGTAQQMAAMLHAPAAPLDDPSVNMRLGTEYLNTLLQKFAGVVPYAVAAYDAGPRRVQDWIAANGDAAAGHDPDAMIDWIEMIPFGETRNYVQRVLENSTVYAARLGAERAP